MQNELLEWVENPASLTKRLNDYTHHQIQFVLNKQGWSDENTWCREISWKYRNKTWVLAKTLIPKETLDEFTDVFLKNSERPIGEILFSDRAWVRGVIAVSQIDFNNDYYCWAKNYVSELPQKLTMRESDFSLGNAKLTVIEIFMPDFLHVE